MPARLAVKLEKPQKRAPEKDVDTTDVHLLVPERKDYGIEVKFEIAAALVQSALNGKNSAVETDVKVLEESGHARRCYKIYIDTTAGRSALLFILFCLPLFEVPPWCLSNDKSDPCDDADYPLSGIGFIPVMPYLAFQLVLSCVLLADIILQMQFSAFELKWGVLPEFHKSIGTFTENQKCLAHKFIVSVLLLLDCFISMCWALKYQHMPIRISSYCTVDLFVLYSNRLRQIFRDLFVIVPKVFDIVMLMFVFIFYFAWVFQVAFDGTTEGDTYFSSLGDGLNNMIIFITTNNNPSLWIPAYTDYRLSCLPFVFFLAIGLFLIMNMLLATVYEAYKTQLQAEATNDERQRQLAMMTAFRILDSKREVGEDDAVTFPEMQGLFREMRKYRFLANSNDESTLLGAFKHLDTSNDGLLQFEEFLELTDLMVVQISEDSDVDSLPLIYMFTNSKELSDIEKFLVWLVNHPGFEQSVVMLLMVNAIFVVIEVETDSQDSTAFESFELVFAVAYVIEVVLKFLFLENFPRYISNKLNAFDCLVSIGIGVATVLSLTSVDTDHVITILQMVRMTRLIRALASVKRYRDLFHSICEVTPHLMELMLALFCIMYMFAILGVQLYGGLVRNAGNNSDLEGTDYEAAGFEVINFNDYPGSLLMCFNLMIANGWNTFMDAYVEVSHTEWTKVYFIVFWLVVGTYAFNVLVSYILETVLNLMTEIEREKESESITPRPSTPRGGDQSDVPSTVVFKKARSMSADVAEAAVALSRQLKTSLKYRPSIILNNRDDAKELVQIADAELADPSAPSEHADREENQKMNDDHEKKDGSTEDTSPNTVVEETDETGPLDEAGADEYGTFAKPRQASTG